MTELLLKRAEAAKRLNISASMMGNLIRRGQIRHVFVGARAHIPESAIAEYIAAHTVEVAS